MKQAHPNLPKKRDRLPEGRENQRSSQTGGIWGKHSLSVPSTRDGRSGGAKETGFNTIIQQIQRYPLENSTPLETMLFVQKLKQETLAKFLKQGNMPPCWK